MTPIQALTEKIDQLTKKIDAQGVQPMNVDQAAAYLSISRSYLYRLTSGGLIVHYKTAGGKQLTFLKSDLDKWLTAHRVAPRWEIAQGLESCPS